MINWEQTELALKVAALAAALGCMTRRSSIAINLPQIDRPINLRIN